MDHRPVTVSRCGILLHGITTNREPDSTRVFQGITAPRK
jgi:hypothetical protein